MSPNKRVRKSLDRKWSTPGEVRVDFFSQNDSILMMPETPSKSLIGDQSIVFSPPSIIKETLHGCNKLNEAFALPQSPRNKLKNTKSLFPVSYFKIFLKYSTQSCSIVVSLI